MKAKELMIGDWVRMRLSFGTQWYIDKVGIINPENDMEYDPIPLSEEILKVNGFEVCYESCYQTKYNVWLFDDEVCVEYKFSKQTEDYNHLKIFIDGGERVSIHILNVHELQHALRLCGLNELADNFKIE